MAVITISRELGSNGDEIVNLLCTELGYLCIDKAFLTKMALDAGVDVKAVLAKEKDVTKKPKLISDQMTSLYGRAPSAFAREGGLDDQTYTRIVRETMEQSAREGDAIIVGRGGQMVLRDWPNALHVHLYASIEIRAQRLVERANISPLEARRHIERSDEQKRQYVRQLHSNANWKDVKHYHLAINTGHISSAIAVQMIVLAVQDIAGT